MGVPRSLSVINPAGRRSSFYSRQLFDPSLRYRSVWLPKDSPFVDADINDREDINLNLTRLLFATFGNGMPSANPGGFELAQA